MKVLIIEDELPALEKLERYILKYDNSSEIVGRLTGITEAVSWLQNGTSNIDIVFMDIQLSDGLSFEIFNQVTLNKPVIFVTAFDEYAIDAFKVNSIDYILKPITFTEVSKALNKYKNLKKSYGNQEYANITKALTNTTYKDRFLVRMGNHIYSIKASEIALFYAEGRTVFLMTHDHKKYVLDYKLEDLSKVLDPKQFYRTNRTFIINLNAITDVLIYSKSRLKVITHVTIDKDIIVSRERVSNFKQWYEGIRND